MLKCLTLWQPHATFVALGLKSIETRVTFSDGVVWSHVRKTGPLARAKTGSPDVQDAEDFLPYLR